MINVDNITTVCGEQMIDNYAYVC